MKTQTKRGEQTKQRYKIIDSFNSHRTDRQWVHPAGVSMVQWSATELRSKTAKRNSEPPATEARYINRVRCSNSPTNPGPPEPLRPVKKFSQTLSLASTPLTEESTRKMNSTEYVNVPRTLQNLKQEVSQENYEAINQFINEVAAEGIGESQQQRLIYNLKTVLNKFSPNNFTLKNASEDQLKGIVANLNRSDYAESTKAKFRASLKKFYKLENGGHEHPEKVDFFSVHNNRKDSNVTRDELFTDEDFQNLLTSFNNTRDRAFTLTLYETAARPGELLECSIGDFTTNEKGDFLYLQGPKGTPDRTNQLVRAGRTLREWIAHHPLGGEIGNIDDPSAPLWVKKEQQQCQKCGERRQQHDLHECHYKPDLRDQMNYNAYRRRFKKACNRAGIPDNKQRPYNLRHTRLTEVATFMDYEQLNKFAGWKPGSDRAKVSTSTTTTSTARSENNTASTTTKTSRVHRTTAHSAEQKTSPATQNAEPADATYPSNRKPSNKTNNRSSNASQNYKNKEYWRR